MKGFAANVLLALYMYMYCGIVCVTTLCYHNCSLTCLDDGSSLTDVKLLAFITADKSK